MVGIAILLIGVLGCRPVIAVGWQEMVVLAGIVVILIGPLLFRLYRSWLGGQEVGDMEDEARGRE
jgi:hypothetical protein